MLVFVVVIVEKNYEIIVVEFIEWFVVLCIGSYCVVYDVFGGESWLR